MITFIIWYLVICTIICGTYIWYHTKTINILSVGDVLMYIMSAFTPIINVFFLFAALEEWVEPLKSHIGKLLEFEVYRKKE